jgi:hypothetical protein
MSSPSFPVWLIFVFGTVVCWGAYGSMMHEGQRALDDPWKAVLCVGAAYFLLAVIVPAAILILKGASFEFTARGATFASIGGALGALGAIFIIGSLRTGGVPFYVMPLVFGGAPLVNVLVSMALHPPQEKPNPMLYAGFLIAATGAAMVLYFRPVK